MADGMDEAATGASEFAQDEANLLEALQAFIEEQGEPITLQIYLQQCALHHVPTLDNTAMLTMSDVCITCKSMKDSAIAHSRDSSA